MLEADEIWKVLEQRHGKERQDAFRKAHVAICGLGGLGSNIAVALARAGVGHLHLIDFDYVEVSNVHRQQYYLGQIGKPKTEALKDILRQIHPFIDIHTDFIKLDEKNTPQILKDDDIICEALDQPEAKAMLVNSILEMKSNKYVVASSGMAGMEDANQIHTRKIMEKFYLCGDEKSDIRDGIGLTAARVMICAGHQAHKVLQIIEKEEIKNDSKR